MRDGVKKEEKDGKDGKENRGGADFLFFFFLVQEIFSPSVFLVLPVLSSPD
jgi:hypothetical protein